MGSMHSELLMELLFGLRALEQQSQTIIFIEWSHPIDYS